MNKIVKKEDIQFAVLAVDVICFRIIGKELYVLLGEVNAAPFYKNKLGLIGGLIAPEETADEAVARHMKNKVGVKKIKDVYREQVYTFSEVGRDPRGRVVSVAYLAITNKDVRNINKAAVKTNWHKVTDIPNLAYDHNEIFLTGLERLRAKVEYTNIVQYFLPAEFTLTQLQERYEIIVGRKVDKRNFRRKVLKLKMIKKIGKRLRGKATRPAELYKFVSKEIKIYEIFF
jgi:8-oxo-dGTP diphosphatase